MKLHYSVFMMICLLATSSFSQSITSLEKFTPIDNSIWLEGQMIQADEHDVIDRLMDIKRLDGRHQFVIINERKDDLGMEHVKYQQFYNDIPVKGAQIIAHYKEHKLELINGRVAEQIRVPKEAIIDASDALDVALQAHGGVVYMWENVHYENVLKMSQNDPFATYFPNPKLVIVDRHFPRISGQYALAYELKVYSSYPRKKTTYFVSAVDGSIILALDDLHVGGVEGTAITKYSGEQKITTEEVAADEFRLYDDTRGAGIWTLNSNEGNPIEFVDDDNYWNNVNAEQDEIATDIHLGAEATYDYFYNTFGWESFDNQGTMIISYGHEGMNFNNAYWDGTAMHYGDGDGVRYGPFTTIDVCGHELTHGVTEFSAGLIYSYESGALNESFSDIFGKAIEYEVAPSTFTWFLGKSFSLEDKAFRDMKDPNSTDDPKYYKGKDYWFLTGDNGGVHSNSGVQNHWYYLLVEGGSGTNEKGYNYNVPSIGWEKASAIAFRSLTTYLTPNSDFKDAYRGSVRSAGDLYGPCSDEYKAVIEAWATVGLSEKIVAGDLALIGLGEELTGCSITGVSVNLAIQNVSCEFVVEAGEALTLYYRLNSDPINQQMVTFDNGLQGGQFETVTLNTALSITTFGPQVLTVWFEYNNPVLRNDTLVYEFLNKEPAYTDIKLNDIFITNSNFCIAETQIGTFIVIEYDGCEEIPPPIELLGEYEVNGRTGTVSYTIRDTLKPGSVSYSFGRINEDLERYGLLTLNLKYPNDANQANSQITKIVGPVDAVISPYTENMVGNEIDSTYTYLIGGEYTQTNGQTMQGDDAIWISGNTLLDGEEVLAVSSDDLEIILRANEKFVTKVSYCAYLSQFISPLLRLDMAQSSSDFDYASYDIDPNSSVLAGIELQFASGVMMLDIINDPQDNPQLKRYDYDLTEYKDTLENVHLYFFGITKDVDVNGDLTMRGDNNIVSQIAFLDQSLSISKFSEDDVLISPNPSNSSFNVQIKNEDHSVYELGIFDLHGRKIESSTISAKTAVIGETLDPGLYSLQILNEGEILYRQMIVKI